MALVAIDGFDMYDGNATLTGMQTRWATPTPAQVSAVTGRFGGQAMRLEASSSESTASRSFPAAVGDAAVGAALRFNALPPNTTSAHKLFLSGTTPHVGWRVTSTGAIAVARITSKAALGTTLGVTAGPVVAANTWHFIETEVVISDTVGRVTIWVDGAQVLNLTGQDTRNGTPTTIDTVCLGWPTTISRGPIVDVDDYYQADAATRIGEGFIETLRPSSDSAITFTPSSGANNFSRVNEATVDGDTTYNQGTTVGNADLFGMTSLATAPATVYGVQLVDFMRKTDAATRTVYQEIKSGGTTDDGAAVALAANFGRFERMLLNDPNTAAAWAYTAVNAALKGYKIAS